MKVRPAATALLIAAALSVSACGSSAGSGSAATTPTAAPPGSAASAGSSAKSSAAGAVSSVASSAAAAGAVDVCAILPLAQAVRLTGKPYVKAADFIPDDPTACTYSDADGTVPGVTVTVISDPDGDTWTAVHTGDLTDVAGVGTKAFWDNDNTLYAAKGADVVQVNGDALDQNTAASVAAVVIAALP